jgi:coiled-coil domain-containing protein 130
MQGFNMGRYVPPEHEGVTSSNALHKKKPPGMRAGTQTVRFEMPFPIWCTHCPKPTIIGQGVRFNAIKTKVGNYYSTPIFAFRIKHVACGGEIEIRTDPRNTAYVVAEGARKRDTGDDKLREGDMVILTEEEREKLREDALAGLEFKKAEEERAKGARDRIQELRLKQEELWEDPYGRNRRLRAAFRVGRHERERDAVKSAALQDKMSLGIELAPETEEDKLRAGLVDFTGRDDTGTALVKPLFTSASTEKSSPAAKRGRLKSEVRAEKAKASIASTLQSNTRAKLDPFLSFGRPENTHSLDVPLLSLRKRKHIDVTAHDGGNTTLMVEDLPSTKTVKTTQSLGTGLVDYDSD